MLALVMLSGPEPFHQKPSHALQVAGLGSAVLAELLGAMGVGFIFELTSCLASRLVGMVVGGGGSGDRSGGDSRVEETGDRGRCGEGDRLLTGRGGGAPGE